MYAARNGLERTAQLLLGRRKIGFNKAEYEGHTALIYAATKGHDRGSIQ